MGSGSLPEGETLVKTSPYLLPRGRMPDKALLLPGLSRAAPDILSGLAAQQRLANLFSSASFL